MTIRPVLRFEDMPSIGPAMAADFRLLGLKARAWTKKLKASCGERP